MAWARVYPNLSGEAAWQHGCSNADASLLAIVHTTRAYKSTDRGASWSEMRPAGDVDMYWMRIACSSSGAVILLGGYSGAGGTNTRIWLSKDYGASWTEQRPAGDVNSTVRGLGVSSDGQTLILCRESGRLYVSYDCGANWTEKQPAGAADKAWYCAAVSGNGQVMYAGIGNGRLYRSTDAGANWAEVQPAGAANKFWISVNLDYDGSHVVAYDNARYWVSTNSGASWTDAQPEGNYNHSWKGVGMSKNGEVMLAGRTTGCWSESTNNGSTWTKHDVTGNGTTYARSYSVAVCDDEAKTLMAAISGTTPYAYVNVRGTYGPTWSDLAVTINDGDASTTDPNVTLALSALVDGEAPDEMALSDDGVTWGPWEAYAESRDYELTHAGGTKTVYAKFRAEIEGEQEESDPVSDSIVLTIVWTARLLINHGVARSASREVELALAAESSAGAVTDYRLRENSGSWGGWLPFAPGADGWLRQAYTLDGYGERLLEVQYRDEDGNPSAIVPATILVLTPLTAAELMTAESAQTILAGVLVYYDGELLAELRPIAGSVSADGRRAVMRTCSVEFAPDAERTHRDIYELLTIPGIELVVRRGWVTPAGGELIFSLGRFVVDETTYTRGAGGTTVTVDGSDVSVKIQRARWTEPYQVAKGTALATALDELLRDRWSGVQVGFDAVSVPDLLGAQAIFEVGSDSDPWSDAQGLAAAHSYVLYPDNEGVFRLRVPPDPATTAPLYSYRAGETAVITETSVSSPMERVYNGVVATGEGSELDVPVRGEAWDEDPKSPTSIHGPFGWAPYFYSSPLITTEGQAENAARSLLAKVLGRLEQLAWRQIANPCVQPLDPVEVEDEDGVMHTYLIDEITVPLSASETMTATARETRLSF